MSTKYFGQQDWVDVNSMEVMYLEFVSGAAAVSPLSTGRIRLNSNQLQQSVNNNSYTTL